ncbi:GNAT family N-acetyltransferase [Streptacidiphilus jiangxiensis]|uniref:Acetyltransferase (GNAT) family protein n=1 Tax=Streptacidiphilus jiangxiensis TaxID=235985 RepID=A0A1H7U1V1_STRJI|nr:GNAT family N-acetyltransferase [Streptacidiphilus jiangxiensis]SEL91060.1 Acetyltransferase (GNAT) family protein [Streptacidiphilus jiangxiensis]
MKRSHSSQSHPSTRHRWRRDTVELSAVFAAVAVADLVANVVVHGHDGPVLLLVSALALVATAVWHSWWTHRHTHAPPGTITSASHAASHAASDVSGAGDVEARPAAPTAATPPEEVALWRVRVTVADAPGSLAALCRGLADIPVNIVSMQAHPLAEETVDEFVVRASPALPPQELSRALVAAGGTEVWLERADAHDLVDIPTRVLTMATRTAHDAAELPLALRQLFGRCRIRSVGGERIDEDELNGAVMRLRDPAGGVIELTRVQPPFTPTEFARARALVELDAQLGPRVPEDRATLRLSGERTAHTMREIAVRRAEPADRVAAAAMHERCSSRTLRQRYHGPVGDADRYLGHLLDPRHGQTLAVESEDGAIVALAHLLWDEDAAEIAVLVEDAWQRHGIGGALVQRLTELARSAGVAEVYAVTTAANTGMISTLRRLGVPLDYQVEEGTLVITAHLSPVPVEAAAR